MDDKYYSKYINELHKRYETDPVSAVDLLSDSINRIKLRKLSLDEKQINVLLMVVISLLMLITSFICNEEVGMSIFGIIFFFAGLFIALYIPIFGLIFLFSHGATGFYFLNQDVFNILLKSTVFSDPTNYMTKYLSVTVIVLLCAFVATIAHNVLAKVREIKYIKPIILLLWLAAILLLRLIPYRMGISEIITFFH